MDSGNNNPPRDADEPEGETPAEDESIAGDDDLTVGDEGEDISRELQADVNRLEQSVWHAPQGKWTRVAAIFILILLLGSLAALLVLAIVSAST